MPKVKTRRAAAKRFRRTPSGKIRCGHACKRHILTKKSRKKKNRLKKQAILGSANHERIVRCLPNG